MKNIIIQLEKLFLLVLGWALIMPMCAWADDGAVYIDEPRFRIESSKQLFPEKVIINLNGDLVSVKYSLVNKAESENKLNIVFDTAPFNFAGSGNWYPDRSYSDFSLVVNGTKVPYKLSSVAYFNGKDVSSKLHQYNLVPNDVGDVDRWTEEMTGGLEKFYQPLTREGIIDDNGTPDWTAKNTYGYKLTMQPKEALELEYSYKTLPGATYFSEQEQHMVEPLHTFNLSLSDMRVLYGGKNGNKDFYTIVWQRLPLWPDNWKDGIGELTINVSTPKEDHDPYMVGVLINGQAIYHKESLHFSQKNFKLQNRIELTKFYPSFNRDGS